MAEHASFGRWMRARRKALDLTQEALAERIGCATITLRRIETEERRPSLQIARNLAEELGIPPEQLPAFLRLARAEGEPPPLPGVAAPIAAPAVATEPGTATDDEPEAALSLDTAALPPAPAPPGLSLPPLVLPPLPVPPTPLVGRAHVVAAVRDMLVREDVRLLTLMGAGGIGKTRLAVALAHAVRDDFADDVCYVSLAAVRDPAQVGSTIRRAIGVTTAGASACEEIVAERFGERHLLLVLDNFEQVLPAAPVVARLLAECPRLTVLVTSRAALHLSGEHEYRVPPLALPDARHAPDAAHLAATESVRLFVARAEAVRAGFSPTPEELQIIGDICRRLDGLPLAIELAAARVKLLSPRALRDRLTSRLSVLTSGPRDLPARQQTLRDAVAWSHDLLSPAEQRLFARLAVFAGGASVESVEAVCGDDAVPDAFEGVEALLDQSMVFPAEGATGEARVGMLAVLREYAREQLAAVGELAAMEERHARHFLAFAEEAETHLRGAGAGEWLTRLGSEWENVQAALAWAYEARETAVGLRLSAAMGRFWEMRGYFAEGRQWPERFLALPLPENPSREVRFARAHALNGVGVLAYRQSDYARARESIEAALAAYEELGEARRAAAALNNLGLIETDEGNYDKAGAMLDEALARRRALGDRDGIAVTLNNLCLNSTAAGDYAAAEAHGAEALRLFRELGHAWGAAMALTNLGDAARRQGEHERAIALLSESVASKRELGDRWGVAYSLVRLGFAAFALGEHAQAHDAWAESVRLCAETHYPSGVCGSLMGFARLAFAEGDVERATMLFGAATALYAAINTPLTPATRAQFAAVAAEMEQVLGAAGFAAARTAGAGLSQAEAIALALSSATATAVAA